MLLFAVTGTNGKTTVTWILRQLLQNLGLECGLIGTLGNYIGTQVLPTVNTTPGNRQLRDLLKAMEEQSIGACALEASSHGIVQGRLSGLEPETGIFTNLTPDHLDYHGTMEDYYRAKKQLFDRCRRALINLDGAYGPCLAEDLKREGKTVFTCTLQGRAESLLETADFGPQQAEELLPENLPLPGDYNRSNAFLAAACCRLLGIPARQIRAALETVTAPPGRLEEVPNCLGIRVFVDYAHTPDALEKVLAALGSAPEPRGRILTVFGCGGSRDAQKRPAMGLAAGRGSDLCILTRDNPREERDETIFAAIEKGLLQTACPYTIVADRREAIAYGLRLCKAGDTLLIAGKGHETTQIIGKETFPFHDGEVAAELLRQLHKKGERQ